MEILLICMPIFIIIILGKILLRFELLDHQFINSSNKLVMNIFLPILLFNEISKSNFNEVFSYKHVIIMLAAITLVYMLSFPLGSLFKLSGASSRTFVTNSFRANAAFVGLPVCFYAFGSQGLSIASIYLAFMIPLNNVLGIMAYNTSGYKLSDLKEMIKTTALNPLIIAAAIGLAFSMLEITLPGFISKTMSILSGVALPMALLGIGANINLDCLQGNKIIIAVSAGMKLVILPLIAFLVLKIMNIESFGLLEKVLIILLASPSAQVNYIFAAAMQGDPDLASGGIIISTILSALTFIGWISIINI
ncbi:MAG: AEC family transporter [Syntrophomonas sp.]|nr:AEC family transporter [Syntrophomonas sp.]